MKSVRRFGSKLGAGKARSIVFLPVFSCLIFLSCSFATAADQPPNFVVIFADDLGYGDNSCYGPTGVETPHLDALAAEGFRSTDFCVPANVCSTARWK